MNTPSSSNPKMTEEKAKMQLKFNDTLENFHELLAILGFAGELKKKGSFYAFHTKSGAVINWWPSNGRIYVQGAALPKMIVDAALVAFFAPAQNDLEASLVPHDAPPTDEATAGLTAEDAAD
jgi:hypothetical protein